LRGFGYAIAEFLFVIADDVFRGVPIPPDGMPPGFDTGQPAQTPQGPGDPVNQGLLNFAGGSVLVVQVCGKLGEGVQVFIEEDPVVG
jgi:hypothetical protein